MWMFFPGFAVEFQRPHRSSRSDTDDGIDLLGREAAIEAKKKKLQSVEWVCHCDD
jgi:hypothetical protein